MIMRYFQIKDYLHIDEELAGLIPSPVRTQQLLTLYKGVLVEIEAVTKYIQTDGISLLDVRGVFDSLMELDALRVVNFDANYLRPASVIVHDASFESGIVKLCKESFSSDDLSAQERRAVELFRIDDEPGTQSDGDYDDASSVGSVLLRDAKRRRITTDEHKYYPVVWSPPTSNSVERFFSTCKQVYSDFRQRLTPLNLEMQLYLKMLADMWFDNPSVVAQAIKSSD